MSTVTLQSLASTDREQFIKDNQEAFNYGALEEFGLRDDHFEEEVQIISHDTIEQSIDSGEAYRILSDGDTVGGAVIKVDGKHGDLELLFIKPNGTVFIPAVLAISITRYSASGKQMYSGESGFRIKPSG